jgi:DNA-binding NtrC family response regulator
MKLTDRFGLDDKERQRRLRFLGLDEEDAARLRGIHEMAEAQADKIIDKLYNHILSFEETRAFFPTPEILERVKSYQRRYFVELTTGATDEAYFGVDAFKEIKKLSPSTRVILMTAYSVQGLIDEALSEGVLAVLDKPVGVSKVLGLLESLKGESSLLIVDEKPDPSKH